MKIRLRLAELLHERGMTRYALSQRTEIQFPTLDRYYKNKVIRYDSYVLAKICEALNCDISDILECVPDDDT